MSRGNIPHVVLVGRKNVGKSSLFNRLIEQNKSLVSALAGTTRDIFESDCIWRGKVIRMVDTGGLDIDKRDALEQDVASQAREAMKSADAIIFVVDAQAGLQSEDLLLAKELLKSKKPVIAIANKADNIRIRTSLEGDAWRNFVFQNPIAVSARQGVGAGDLLDRVFDVLEEIGKPPADIVDVSSMRVSVLGRPNVGKSTLLNNLIGKNRFIASAQEHTTRSPNDTLIEVDGKSYTLIDTAGVRKMARVRGSKSKLETAGVDRTMRTIGKSDVILFVIDISQRIQMQDKFLAGAIEESGASVIIVANKWDVIPDKETNTVNEYEEYIRTHLPSLAYAPIVFTSAKTGKRVAGLFEVIQKVFRARFTQLNQEQTREFISRAIVKHKPSRGKGVAHPRISFFRQINVNPPTFQLGVRQHRASALNKSYLRFLQNRLRTYYDFEGTPIKIRVAPRKKSHTT